VFSAIRVGGLAGRVHDERAALDLGVLGQETTGAAGIAFALRTGPVALEIARTVAAEAPKAFVINFTNPAGIMTELMQTVLGGRVIGICDTPSGLGKRVGALYGADEFDLSLDYVGLNHLGWLRHAWYRGRDLVAEVLADPDKLSRLEEADVFSIEWMQRLGALPNEYLYYWYSTREAIASILSADATRGEFLEAQQSRFYRAATAEPERALELWTATHDEREATYMAEAREEGEERPDLSGGGYERVALALMRAIALNERAEMIVNVRNGHTLAALPEDAVIEVPSLVDGAGAHPLSIEPPGGAELGLMMQMKAVEQLAIRAVLEHDRGLAFEALAKHPLVDSVTVAEKLTEVFWPED
jgi:6-phospho-beta-glucosidase